MADIKVVNDPFTENKSTKKHTMSAQKLSLQKEIPKLELDAFEEGNSESKAVFSNIQTRGSKEWLLNNDIPKRPVGVQPLYLGNQ